MSGSNSLGLENLSISDPTATKTETSDRSNTETTDWSKTESVDWAASVEGDDGATPKSGGGTEAAAGEQAEKKPKQAPYINPDRVLTGGQKPVRVRLIRRDWMYAYMHRTNSRMKLLLSVWPVCGSKMRKSGSGSW
jgi:hypothetical protein